MKGNNVFLLKNANFTSRLPLLGFVSFSAVLFVVMFASVVSVSFYVGWLGMLVFTAMAIVFWTEAIVTTYEEDDPSEEKESDLWSRRYIEQFFILFFSGMMIVIVSLFFNVFWLFILWTTFVGSILSHQLHQAATYIWRLRQRSLSHPKIKQKDEYEPLIDVYPLPAGHMALDSEGELIVLDDDEKDFILHRRGGYDNNSTISR